MDIQFKITAVEAISNACAPVHKTITRENGEWYSAWSLPYEGVRPAMKFVEESGWVYSLDKNSRNTEGEDGTAIFGYQDFFDWGGAFKETKDGFIVEAMTGEIRFNLKRRTAVFEGATRSFLAQWEGMIKEFDLENLDQLWVEVPGYKMALEITSWKSSLKGNPHPRTPLWEREFLKMGVTPEPGSVERVEMPKEGGKGFIDLLIGTSLSGETIIIDPQRVERGVTWHASRIKALDLAKV